MEGYLNEVQLFLVDLSALAGWEHLLHQLLHRVVVHRVCVDVAPELMQVAPLWRAMV